MHAVLASSLVLLLAACGGGSAGPEADESKTPEQVKQEVAAAEKPVLEQAVQQYKSAIAALETEKGDLEKQIKELGGKALDGLLGGEGKGEEVEKGAAALQQQVKDIMKQVEGLTAKLQIYVDELASRK